MFRSRKMPSTQLIAVLSLVIALLAVFVGPFWQSRVAHRQMLGPMRQGWINELRRKVSLILGRATFYAAAGHPPTNTEAVYLELTEIQQEIELMINPREKDHQDLVASIAAMMRTMTKAISPNPPFDAIDIFKTEQRKVVALAQKIFKTEWDRVRTEG